VEFSSSTLPWLDRLSWPNRAGSVGIAAGTPKIKNIEAENLIGPMAYESLVEATAAKMSFATVLTVIRSSERNT